VLLAVNKINCGSYRFSFCLLPESNPHRRRNPGNFGGAGGDHRSSNHNLYNIGCSSGRGHAPVRESARARGPASDARDPARARTPSHGRVSSHGCAPHLPIAALHVSCQIQFHAVYVDSS